MRNAWLGLAALAACGGKVVVDAEGVAGAGGSQSTSSSVVTSGPATSGVATGSGSVAATSGSGVDCAALGQAYEAALAQAAQCYACKDADDCINGPVLNDTCNCPRGLNGGIEAQSLVADAKQALQAFVMAGCPFLECGKDCAVGTTWHCGGPDPTCNASCHTP